jgi:hypothetical protein
MHTSIEMVAQAISRTSVGDRMTHPTLESEQMLLGTVCIRRMHLWESVRVRNEVLGTLPLPINSRLAQQHTHC